ncbi:hypothetical protein OURE66S_04348 [Oligella ureolytica]
MPECTPLRCGWQLLVQVQFSYASARSRLSAVMAVKSRHYSAIVWQAAPRGRLTNGETYIAVLVEAKGVQP